jgi:N-methylhydantoinase B
MAGTGIVASEVIRAGLAVAAEEASAVVVRSSHSTFIQEGADACAALLGVDGRLIVPSTATSLLHSCSLRCALPLLLEIIPLDEIEPGDVLATNDPYAGGIHANDVLVFEPIFLDGAVCFFAGTLVHVADVGGSVAGGLASTATDMFQEGLTLPGVKLYDRGVLVEPIWRILVANSRVPDKVVGDVKALVAGTSVLRRRVEALSERWGAATVVQVADEWLDYAERRMRAELEKLPDGEWTGAYTIETDGVEEGREFDVCVRVTIDGDRCAIDFTGTSAQSRGAINASESQALSGALYAVRCFVDPTIPMNEGCLRPLDIRLPKGSLVNPHRPAACGGRIVTVAAGIEAIIGALSEADPELGTAASSLVQVFTLAGASGAPWLTLLYEFGGLGGRHGSDGPDATGAFFLGGRNVVPQIEPLEVTYPVLVHEACLRPDSGGVGRWRGGLGLEMSIEMREDTIVTVRGDRLRLPPSGRAGGEPGLGGFFAIRRADGTTERLKPKQANVTVVAGEVLVVATSGGGGVGSAGDRDPDAVRADLAAGYISAERARDAYGLDTIDATTGAGA